MPWSSARRVKVLGELKQVLEEIDDLEVDLEKVRRQNEMEWLGSNMNMVRRLDESLREVENNGLLRVNRRRRRCSFGSEHGNIEP